MWYACKSRLWQRVEWMTTNTCLRSAQHTNVRINSSNVKILSIFRNIFDLLNTSELWSAGAVHTYIRQCMDSVSKPRLKFTAKQRINGFVMINWFLFLSPSNLRSVEWQKYVRCHRDGMIRIEWIVKSYIALVTTEAFLDKRWIEMTNKSIYWKWMFLCVWCMCECMLCSSFKSSLVLRHQVQYICNYNLEIIRQSHKRREDWIRNKINLNGAGEVGVTKKSKCKAR